MLPVLLALLSSFCFAVSNIVINRGLVGMDFLTGLVVNLVTNTLFLWVFLVFFIEVSNLWVPVNLIYVGTGLLVPGLARFFIFKGMERLGASITASLLNVSPLFAILFAFLFLAERPTPSNLLGALFIVFGVIQLSWRGQTKTWRTWDLIYPLVGAFLFAFRDNLVRFGLLIVHSPIVGATIAATTSALTISVFYYVTTDNVHSLWAKTDQKGWLFFIASGFMNFLSYLFMYSALNLDQVSIVSPLVNCSSFFVLPLAFFLLKGIERITLRKVSSTVVVVLGVFLISWEKF